MSYGGTPKKVLIDDIEEQFLLNGSLKTLLHPKNLTVCKKQGE